MESDPKVGASRCAELELSNLNATYVSDEIELLSAVHNHEVDLALVHLSASETIGSDYPRVIREVAATAYLPVVIVTDKPWQRRCELLECGADDVVSFSIEPDELLARIGSLLRIKILHDELALKQTQLQESLDRELVMRAQLEQDNDQLRHLATTDSLTRVQNRRSFDDLLDHEFHSAKRYGQPLSLLMLDIDHFKVVNDQHGHPSGDYVLKELAVILNQNVRESDVVARTGGEEFSVILPRASRQEAEIFAQRIRLQVSKRQFIVYGDRIHITISIGSATFPEDAEITDPGILEYLADQALLTAKESGRDRVVAVNSLGMAVRSRLRRQYFAMNNEQLTMATTQ